MPITPRGHYIPVDKDFPGDKTAEFTAERVMQEQASALREFSMGINDIDPDLANSLEQKIAKVIEEHLLEHGDESVTLPRFLEIQSALYGMGNLMTRSLRRHFHPGLTPVYHLTVQRLFAVGTMGGVEVQDGTDEDEDRAKVVAGLIHAAIDHGPPVSILASALTGDLDDDMAAASLQQVQDLKARLPEELRNQVEEIERQFKVAQDGTQAQRQEFVDMLIAKTNEMQQGPTRILALAKASRIAAHWGCTVPAVDVDPDMQAILDEGVETDANGIGVAQVGDRMGAIVLPEGVPVDPAAIKAAVLAKFPQLADHPQLEKMVAQAASEHNTGGSVGGTRH